MARARTDQGDPKFLAPAGRAVPIYTPPAFDRSGSGQIVVVEGPVKAIALEHHGIEAVALGGTGTTLTVGSDRELNSSWDCIELDGRLVIVLFDSNRVCNPAVARDEARLAVALERAGADVRVASLPHGPRGKQWGPDDFLASNGAEALLKVIEGSRIADPVRRVREALA